MSNVALASINSFASQAMQADFVPREDHILEVSLTELQSLSTALAGLFNDILDLDREERLLEKKEASELLISAQHSIQNEKSPIQKLLILIAYVKKAFKPVKDAISRRPAATATDSIIQAATKIKLRAIMLFEHVKTIAKGENRKKDFAFSSPDVRTFLAGKEGQAPSRRDAIRAMERAEHLFPALKCEHTPNDGRATMRLIARIEELDYCNYIKEDRERDNWQRFKMGEVLPFMN